MRAKNLLPLATMILIAIPAQAGTRNLMDFWLTDSASFGGSGKPYTCMATNPVDPSTFIRQYAGPNTCSGRTVYSVVKGAVDSNGDHRWDTESYYTSSDLGTGYLRIVQELGSYTSNCPSGWNRDGLNCDATRVFRDSGTGTKSIATLKRQFSDTAATTFSHSTYVEEHWSAPYHDCPDATRVLHSNGTPWNDTGTGTYVEEGYGGFQWGWLYDYRTGRNGSVAHDIEVMIRNDYWQDQGNSDPYEHKEVYWYGHWQDPAAGSTWKSLGLVHWTAYIRASTTSPYVIDTSCGGNCVADNHHLVDCNATVVCTGCPDAGSP